MEKANLPYWLSIIIWLIVILGIWMINSVSVFESNELMVKIHGRDILCDERNNQKCYSLKYPEFSREDQIKILEHGEEYCSREEINCNGFYFFRHIQSVFLGLIAFILALLFPVLFWKRMSLFVFVIALCLLVSLFFIGGEWGTARSWINIPGLPSIQPSEIAKMALILYLALWMEAKQREVRTWHSGFVPFVVLMIPIVVLLALQPDFGSLLVICSVATVMFFIAGGDMLHIFLGAFLALSLVSIPLLMANCDPAPGERPDKLCYIVDRLGSYSGSTEDENVDYQVKQSLLAVGSGQLFGVGLGESGMRYGWLPEIQSDTIFAATAEELGFFRTAFLLFGFLGIALMGFETAKQAKNRFEMLVSSGITAWISFQAIINMAVVLKLFPVTGITLPFISYGGSSLMSLLFACGILIKISHHSSPEKAYENIVSRRRVRRTHTPRGRNRY